MDWTGMEMAKNGGEPVGGRRKLFLVFFLKFFILLFYFFYFLFLNIFLKLK